MKRVTTLSMSLLLAAAPLAHAADQPASSQPTISVEQYQELLREQKEMRQEIQQLKAERAAPATQPAPAATSTTSAAAPLAKEVATVEDIDDLQGQIKKIADIAHAALPGSEHFVVAGDAEVDFVNQNKSPSTFAVVFSPLFLFEPTDHLLFEAGMDVGVQTDGNNNSTTSVDLSIADASVIVNDNLIVGGGLFVVPFGQYHNHFDPPWINKLPDDPIAYTSNLAPGSEVGIFAKSVFPVSCLRDTLPSAKFTTDLYLANGPNLITNDPTAAGQLNFADYTDLNNGKAVGGRFAFLPHPNVEMGYSVQYSQTAPTGFPHVYALQQAVDFNWVQECRPLGGVFTTRAEWVWSQVEHATYDPTGSLGFGPIRLGEWSQGGYCTLAYRPTLCDNQYLRNTEYIFRYDSQHTPLSSPGGEHETRYTFGVDYWLSPAWVLKVAYEFDNKQLGVEQSAFLVQLGLGL